MSKLQSLHYRLLLPFLLLPTAVHAARPMSTDDAAVVEQGFCQVESWAQRNDFQTEWWAMPACGVGPGWELAAGAASVRARSDGKMGSIKVLQLKTAFQPLDVQGWALGLSLSSQFSHASQSPSQLTLNMPLSVVTVGGDLLLHANAGLLRERASGKTDGTWSLGGEYSVTPRLALTLETLGSRRTHSLLQLGMRHNVIPDMLDVDVAYGHRLSTRGSERFVAIGLTFVHRVLP